MRDHVKISLKNGKIQTKFEMNCSYTEKKE